MLACGGSGDLTQSEWERYQEVRAETQVLLGDLHQAAIAAAKSGERLDQRSVLSKHSNLLTPDNVDFLRRVEGELQDSLAAARVTRLRLFLTDCALNSLRLAYFGRIPLLHDAKELPVGKRWLSDLPAPLVTGDERDARDLDYSRWISLLHENLGLAETWSSAQDSLLHEHGYSSRSDFMTQKTGLDSLQLLDYTRQILVATDGLYDDLLKRVGGSGLRDWGDKPDRLDLARFAVGKDSAKIAQVYPLKVVIEGLRGNCVADDNDLIESVSIDVGTSWSTPSAVPIAAPDKIEVVVPSTGNHQQATAAVAAYARALVYAGSESHDFIDLYLDREFDLVTAGDFLAGKFVNGDCEMGRFAALESARFPTYYVLRKLIELRTLCADIRLALTWKPGQTNSSDTLLAPHTRALNVEVALPELLPRLLLTDLTSDIPRLQGILAACDPLIEKRTLSETLAALREQRLRFKLEQCKCDNLLQVYDRLARRR